MPDEGGRAPAFQLVDQHGEKLRLSSLKGRKVLVYFYPKADTPGCTTQACGLRDVADRLGDTVVLGISPDAPAKLARFDQKYGLGFTLLSTSTMQWPRSTASGSRRTCTARSTWACSARRS
jgi:thioredoxin-dependent peroxiredoxin